MYKKFSCSGCGLDDKHLYMEVSDTGFCISCSTITEFTTGKKVLKASQQNPWEDKSFHNWSKDELYLVLHLTGLLATASVKEGEVLFDINPYKEVLKWFGDKQFLENELIVRKNNKLPPFSRLIAVIISSKSKDLSFRGAQEIKIKLKSIRELEVMGPVDSPISRIKKKFRCRLLIRFSNSQLFQKKIAKLLENLKISSKIKLTVDVDPVNFT